MTQRRRWMVGGMCLLTLLSILAAATRRTTAQSPVNSSATLPKKIYTKSLTFDLPILMEDPTRQTLRDVFLYVKTASSAWVKQDRADPTATKFSFRAPQDGEYWFSLVTVDKAGRATPSDVNLEAPGLRVVVDTKPPTIDVQLVADVDGGCTLRCTVMDVNLDPASLRAVGRNVAGDTLLETVTGQPGVFQVRAEMIGNSVRVTAGDLAGNIAVRDVPAKELAAVVKPLAAPPAATLPAPGIGTTVKQPDALTPIAPVMPPTLTPVGPFEKPNVASPIAPVQAPGAADPIKMPLLPLDTHPTAAKPGLANRRIINSTHASIEYRIDQVGPSGVGKVEIYVTHDQGNTWRRAGEDLDRQSPAEIDLPGEGLFGVRLAITNGNGFGGTPPARGEAPHFWVEVDTTPPFVQLRPSEIVAGGGALDIRWSASDSNLGTEAVSLFFRTRTDGPWQPIARGIKNDGVHRWAFPRDAGSQFYFKVEVVDQAGNIARSESQSLVVLDMTEPRASVIGVSGMSKGN